MEVTRRNYLAATGGAIVAASALAGRAEARNDHDADTLYGHGMVWNRDLPGVAGNLKLSFDLRVNLETGVGFGTAGDPIHPDWNTHFAINEVNVQKRPKGETQYEMVGVVTGASNPDNVGLPVRILAETVDGITAIAIRVGDNAFVGAGLVVIAIIAVLMALLLPAIQK